MTPKEKAIELVLKFYPEVQWKLGQEDCIKRAKNCALITVFEIFEVVPDIELWEYYVKVKKEIEKL